MPKQAIDLTGQKFGKLTAIEIVAHNGSCKPVSWLCKCDCGGERIVSSQDLRANIVKDCGCVKKNRLVGKRFGRLVVLEPTDRRIAKCVVWKCQCDCGNIAYVSTGCLDSGTRSCGCINRERMTSHNLTGTRIYGILSHMKGRCYNKNSDNYCNYGGRGIKICQEWLGEHGPENFYKWAMENGYRDDLSIDRIDNDGDYCPENCRWTTMKVQCNNTRHNKVITINGETHNMIEWAKIRGIKYTTMTTRSSHGWSDYDIVMTPVNEKMRHKT